MSSPDFQLARTCDECPWRRDVPLGKFTPARYHALARTVKQGFNPIFACHQTPDTEPQACVGYLLVDGVNNFHVRLAIITKVVTPSKLEAAGPLYDSFEEMARANGAITPPQTSNTCPRDSRGR